MIKEARKLIPLSKGRILDVKITLESSLHEGEIKMLEHELIQVEGKITFGALLGKFYPHNAIELSEEDFVSLNKALAKYHNIKLSVRKEDFINGNLNKYFKE